MVRMVRMVRSLADRTFQLWSRAPFSSWPNRATKPIGVGETVPAGAMVDDLVLGGGFDPVKKCFKECSAGKTVVVVGQPGAFLS